VRGEGDKTTIRILLVDDHPVVRKGIAACLARERQERPSPPPLPSPEIRTAGERNKVGGEGDKAKLVVVGEAANGVEALRKAKELLPDLVLTDIDMPQMNGLVLTQTLRKELPQIKVLILSMHQNTEYVMRILQSGARGYVLKEAPTDELIKAIENVHKGEAFFSSEIARVALNQFVRGAGEGPSPSDLTSREREVLARIAEGLSNKEIATSLNVGVRTVETHRERVMRKLDIHNVAGLTKFAIAKGLVRLCEA